MTPHSNPWGLTREQVAAMDAVCQSGSQKLAARAIGMPVWTLKNHCKRAGQLMRAGTTLGKYLEFDRWRRSQKDGA